MKQNTLDREGAPDKVEARINLIVPVRGGVWGVLIACTQRLIRSPPEDRPGEKKMWDALR